MSEDELLGLPDGFPKTTVYSEVGKGWWPIISQLDICLRNLDPDYTVEEVLSKFGGLKYRFQISEALKNSKDCKETFQRMQELVKFSEALSYRVCPSCGCPAKLYNVAGNIMVRCENHAEQNKIFGELVSYS